MKLAREQGWLLLEAVEAVRLRHMLAATPVATPEIATMLERLPEGGDTCQKLAAVLSATLGIGDTDALKSYLWAEYDRELEDRNDLRFDRLSGEILPGEDEDPEAPDYWGSISAEFGLVRLLRDTGRQKALVERRQNHGSLGVPFEH